MREIEVRLGEDIEQLLRRLYYQSDLTLAEIASQLQIPIGTLGGWMVRLGLDRAQMARRAAKGQVA